MPRSSSRTDPFLVFITAPDRRVARRLATAVLEGRWVACVNLVPGLESHYWWQGKLECAREILLVAKTTRECLPGLQELVLREHPYETPEFVYLPLGGGSPAYLEWIKTSVEGTAAAHQASGSATARARRSR